MELTRTHRILIGVVVAGAVVIAGIGFAGSYAAVRELAEKKGFGDFSLVFPIGIDAGICVLLALDLLLTWIRIPFPLLRQTAWLLTAATIAFNGAAAWPDPLGVGMHAVIPVLFVVAVEAARHAIGRIADITADKHMEGVRISRWLLSPVPTFLLWRRMKLWELRSYEQVIKLEQERLVYQARLRSRFGRGWRRKAPVESLMPLRLAKYGVPLAETAPDGLAAAGLDANGKPLGFDSDGHAETRWEVRAATTESTLTGRIPGPRKELDPAAAREADRTAVSARAAVPGPHTAEHQPQSAVQESGAAGPEHAGQAGPADDGTSVEPEVEAAEQSAEEPSWETWEEFYFEAFTQYVAEQNMHPTAYQLSWYLMQRYGVTDAFGNPLNESELAGHLHEFQRRLPVVAEEPAGHPDQGAVHDVDLGADGVQGHPAEEAEGPAPDAAERTDDPYAQLTAADRYCLAWLHLREGEGREPGAEELAGHLAAQGVTGRSGRPISPATLRRYYVEFRIYGAWSALRAEGGAPDPRVLVEVLAQHGITGQHNSLIDEQDLAAYLPDFERRWQAVGALVGD
ncbi:DUF2637 domain-containing protein [Streptomyces sp. NA04227]|uniref:DUF2637 domain-containing protein n=1 Tax=Streptomyces sp. NA04227 TaxID=2742136 RepID=UPI0020CA7962|nr:DUF2637 domain-containing protein [Streptomyces sp. NA04227]